MALVRCGECGSDVSDKAAACPKCGAPIRAAVKADTGRRCPFCSTPVAVGASVCPGCQAWYSRPSRVGPACGVIVFGALVSLWAGPTYNHLLVPGQFSPLDLARHPELQAISFRGGLMAILTLVCLAYLMRQAKWRRKF